MYKICKLSQKFPLNHNQNLSDVEENNHILLGKYKIFLNFCTR